MPLLRNIFRVILPRRFKPHRVLRGPLRGKQIVTSWHDYPAAILGYAETALVNWLLANAERGETWLDVGAHYGYTCLALCESVGEAGRVYAFEPSVHTAGCIGLTKKRNDLSNLRVIPLALTADDRPRAYEMASTRGMVDSQLSAETVTYSESFLGCSLDSLWPEICNANPKIHGIKIDVQGMEMQVLQGMREILNLQHPILVLEVHKGIDRKEIISLLQESGYDCMPVPIEKEFTDFFDESVNYSFVFTSTRSRT